MNKTTGPLSGSDDSKQQQVENNSRPHRKKGGLLIILLLFVSLAYFTQHEAVVTVECSPEIIATKPDVIMLGAWWCRYCYAAKKYFQQNNIHYCEYDMEQTEKGKQLYEEYGGGLPVLIIGKYKLNGYSERQIETALSRLEK